MSRVVSMLLLAAALAVPSLALAQPAQTTRVRGTVEALDGTLLTVKARDGALVKVRLADTYAVSAYTRMQLADIKPGSYIGVAGTPQPDGSQKAISINIFPESARGLGDGHRPWDMPNSTMTNAAVADTVAGVDGQTLLLKYKDGEKKIIVGPNTPIATFSPGEKSELKPGVAVTLSAVKKDDGMLETARVGVGRDGFVPN